MKKVMISLTVLLALGSTATAGKIVRPWRATTAIVKNGESFDVWFDASSAQTISSVILSSPFINEVNTSITINTGSWEYDRTSGNTYNQRITVTVPVNTPADRYDLILNTSLGEEFSLRSVKVVTEYKDTYHILHASDFHVGSGSMDREALKSARLTAIVKMANIIDAEMAFITGDNIYHPWAADNPNKTNNNDLTWEERMARLYGANGDFSSLGLLDMNAATLMIGGNHDYDHGSDSHAGNLDGKADFWNRNHGLQYHNTTYGNTRVMFFNNGWDSYDISPQIAAATSWISGAGSGGKLRFTAYHVPAQGVGSVNSDLNVDGVFRGHNHNSAKFNPALNKSGQMIEYVSNGLLEQSDFLLFRVDDKAGTYEALGLPNVDPETVGHGLPTGRCRILENYDDAKNVDPPLEEWVYNLTLETAQENNGSSSANTATLVNKFDFPIVGAKVRFVMPKGLVYDVSQGQITQAFDGDTVRVVDVRIDLDANSTTVIDISSGTSPANDARFVSMDVPNTMIPGETYSVRLTMENAGSGTWSSSAGHKLGSQRPQDNLVWGLSRVTIGQSILSGSLCEFTFQVVAPEIPGSYNFQWRMVDDVLPEQGWFGASTPNQVIVVSEPVEPGTNLIQNPSFEEGETTPSFWTAQSGCTAVGSLANAHNGSSSLLINQISAPMKQAVTTLVPGVEYDLSVWVDASGLSGGQVVFDTVMYDAAGQGQFVITSANEGWTQYTGSFTATNTSLTIRMFAVDTNFAGTVYFDQVVLSPVGNPVVGYEKWAQENDVGDEQVDDDNDGLNNLYEYVLGGDPKVGGDEIDPVFIQAVSGFDYSFKQRVDDTNLIYTVLVCTNLVSGTWSNAAAGVRTNGTVGGYMDVTHVMPGDPSQSYIRLKVEKR